MKSLSKVGPNLNPLGLNLDVNLGLGLGLDLILVLVHVHVHGFNHLIRNITNINNNNILMQPLMTYILYILDLDGLDDLKIMLALYICML
jgi:hypothetical protein